MSVSAQQPSASFDAPTTGQVIIPPDAPQETPKKKSISIPKYLILIIVVYTVLLYGFVGYIVYNKNKKTTSPNTITAAELATTPPALPQLTEAPATSSASTHGFNLNESAGLEVINLETPWTEWYKPDAKPTYTDMYIDKNLADKVSVYKYKVNMFIAPKHWYGQLETLGEGAHIVKLYPKQAFDDTGQSIRMYIYEPESLIGVEAAYPFFPWVREHRERFGIGPGVLDVADVATSSAITPHLVTYQDNHVNLELYGAIYQNIEQHLEDKRWSIEQMEVRMFGEDRAYAKQLINTFIEQNNLKKE